MNISIDLLFLKLRVLADLLDIVGLIGLAVFVAAMIWMVIQVANFNSPVPPLIGILLSLVLIAGGLAFSPVSGETADLTVAAWLCDALGVDLGDARKFAEGELGGLQEFMDLFGSGDNDPGEAPGGAPEVDPGPAETGDQPDGGPASNLADTEEDGFLCDETLNGWRVRMTLPAEWKDSCVITNSGDYLDLSLKNAFPKDGTDGTLLWFAVTDDREYVDMLPGVIMTIERGGLFLVANEPTDVQFDYEVPEIMDKYDQMWDDVPGILDSLSAERI